MTPKTLDAQIADQQAVLTAIRRFALSATRHYLIVGTLDAREQLDALLIGEAREEARFTRLLERLQVTDSRT